ncbi:uncharacterized protein [Oryza sativa Japonica Group]|uniref:Uncharacterized protein n=1 Tax=Oryza sativa subsp. japonica TaxID=39947 RepID=A3BWR0_ORYSJ|nr:uncharacterized protein LOC9271794 [Oryza sativa Japonica Group]EAZ43999.1 hypothetical protein OsJ_28622 [Oryza sativa Japonica Group]KAF2915392.1 hypothetical protein DAI22_09g030400 [Oryza sativa Japonica Group]
MDRNTLGHSNLLEELKESVKHTKGKQEDSFGETAKNDHVDHSDLESSNLPDPGKKNVPKDLEALAGAKKDVPEEVEFIEMNSNDLDNKMRRNIGKRNRQDDNGSKTKKSSNRNVQGHGTSRSVKGRTTELTPDPTKHAMGRGATRLTLPHGFV